jgi:hypothetical protein
MISVLEKKIFLIKKIVQYIRKNFYYKMDPQISIYLNHIIQLTEIPFININPKDVHSKRVTRYFDYFTINVRDVLVQTKTGTDTIIVNETVVQTLENNVTVDNHLIELNTVEFDIPTNVLELMGCKQGMNQPQVTRSFHKQLRYYESVHIPSDNKWWIRYYSLDSEQKKIFKQKSKEAYETLQKVQTHKLHNCFGLKLLKVYSKVFDNISDQRYMVLKVMKHYLSYRRLKVNDDLTVDFHGKRINFFRGLKFFIPPNLPCRNVKEVLRLYSKEQLVTLLRT